MQLCKFFPNSSRLVLEVISWDHLKYRILARASHAERPNSKNVVMTKVLQKYNSHNTEAII